MASHAMFDKVEVVCKNFVRVGFPYYAICDSKGELLWINDEESDVDAAAELLKEDLNLIREYNTAIYTIKHFKTLPGKSGKITKATEPDVISTYKKGATEEARQEYKTNRSYFEEKLLDRLDLIQQKQDILEQKLELEDAPDDATVAKEVTATSIIGNLLGNDKVQEALINFFSGIAANFVTAPNAAPKQIAPAPGVRGIAGTETWETVIQKLLDKGVTFEDMVKLSNMTAENIAPLLNLLRMQP